MAEHRQEMHDGRFGDGFDDEIDSGGLGKIGVGLAAACIVAIVIVGLILRGSAPDAIDATVEAAAVEQTLPPGPRLQTAPEHEYRQMRRELDEHIHGYGWIDEGTGTVHIPIGRAIDLLLEQGVDGRAKKLDETVAEVAAE